MGLGTCLCDRKLNGGFVRGTWASRGIPRGLGNYKIKKHINRKLWEGSLDFCCYKLYSECYKSKC